ncbi:MULTISPECIES: hypothetical protein [unclassified Streptomyces]|uniref:hypothetical protein n=1 Tax=unclassified Streptomyces TaxID=2593676 RepID=UPI00382022C5
MKRTILAAVLVAAAATALASPASADTGDGLKPAGNPLHKITKALLDPQDVPTLERNMPTLDLLDLTKKPIACEAETAGEPLPLAADAYSACGPA